MSTSVIIKRKIKELTFRKRRLARQHQAASAIMKASTKRNAAGVPAPLYRCKPKGPILNCTITQIIASPPSMAPLGWMSRYSEGGRDYRGSDAQFSGFTGGTRASFPGYCPTWADIPGDRRYGAPSRGTEASPGRLEIGLARDILSSTPLYHHRNPFSTPYSETSAGLPPCRVAEWMNRYMQAYSVTGAQIANAGPNLMWSPPDPPPASPGKRQHRQSPYPNRRNLKGTSATLA